MARTFANRACTFNTTNTTNANGDSVYTVTAVAMTRYAPVNLQRAPNQVNTGNPSICYLDAASSIQARIMAERHDDRIKITNVQGDTIFLEVNNTYWGFAYRVPANGLNTFDFVNNDGDLSHIHVGHAVTNLALA